MADSEDELARTATAAGPRDRAGAPALGAMLGRYRLEHMLGEGGMGVVHAAFDPDLERRVALKVLRTIDVAGDARQRLLREARAMARLTHENVVVVHEVGTAGDRDYVAMELIDGQTLADWLVAKPRAVEDVIAAFCAAGRGLAAAHAAGLVHRDFKPHNVLRRRDGRIVVTDFGLARGVEVAPAPATIALATTLEASPSQPSGLSGITATGSVLGTPAYMAPEQWSGGVVGPAADQFAFCVALWEALTGARPFRGETIEELKAEVERGPAALDASKLPRRLRRSLVRGLDPDPAKRWPNMDALLAAIGRADRRTGFALMLAGGAFVAAGVLLVLLRGGAPACEPPALDPGQVWSQTWQAMLPPELSEVFNSNISRWAVARATACTADPDARPQQLKCLDGVLARIDIIRKAYGLVPKTRDEGVAGELVDPSVCLGPSPPRLALPDTPDVVAAYNLIARGDAEPAHRSLAAAQAFADRPGLEPCSHALALVAVENAQTEFQAKRSAVGDVLANAEQCDDDRLHADALLMIVPYQFELPVIGPRGMAAIKRADAAVARVAEPQLTARIDILRGLVASQGDHWKESLALADRAIAAYESVNQPRAAVRTVLESIEWRFDHSSAVDLAKIRSLVATWLPVAKRLRDGGNLVLQLQRDDALARYWQGDIQGGHAELIRLWKPGTDEGPSRRIEGEVVNGNGKPVAGATVAAAQMLVADSVGVPLPVGRYHIGDRHLRIATTDATGHFVIPDGPESGAVAAQLGDRRSVPALVADRVKLQVLPTRRISGKVALASLDVTQHAVVVDNPADRTEHFQLLAPVLPGGEFVVDGVPQTKVNVGVAVSRDGYASHVQYTPVPASREPTTGIVLGVAPTTRVLDVIARSTLTAPLDTAQLVIVPGRAHFANVGELNLQTHTGLLVQFGRHPAGEAVPHTLVGQLRPGDLVAHFTDVPAGEVTVCAIGITGDMMDSQAMRKVQTHVDELELRCETVDGAATSVVVKTPPQKRFD